MSTPLAPAVESGMSRTSTAPGATPFWIPVALFVVSGATGLVDQLCFSKYLTYIVGSTAHAVSAVLAAFMAGLAIGAHFGGKLSSRIKNPLFAYGVLELAVAASVALAPFAFQALTPLYVKVAQAAPGSLVVLSGARWCLAMLVVIVPTTAMGATLPFLSRALGEGAAATPAEAARRARRLGILYAANTLGGALGALAAAYAILPALGLTKTLAAAAALSGAIGVFSLLLGRRGALLAEPAHSGPSEAREDAEARAVPQADPGSREQVLLTTLAFASGYLVFSAEVVFTHLLALIIGNSAYAFGLILAVFLTCLFVGASRAPALGRRYGDATLPASLVLTGALLALTLPLWDRLPLVFKGTGEQVASFEGREAVRGLVAFAVLCLPTSLMGLTFPLLLSRVARYAGVGRLVGRLTAVNTIGAVTGSLVTGYLVLPALGSQRVLATCAVVFALLGVATALTTSATAKRFALGFAALALLLALGAPRWDLARLTSGSNVYFDSERPPDELLMMEEDVHGGVTTVARRGDVLTLYTNGKFQGNNGWEMNAQRFFAHYPSLFVPEHRRALVIGLGTGTTLGTIAAYPWQGVDMVEISPAIARAAKQHFGSINRNALDDPKVKLHLADGRNFLLLTTERYGLVSMELSSVWFAGASNLYSREFYRLVHSRLEPGGVFQQWVQLHHMSRRDFATILHTLADEFDHVTLFYGGGQGILVASERPLVASRAHLERMQADPTVHDSIPNNRLLATLLDDVIVTDKGLRRFIEDSARQAGLGVGDLVSSDDNLYLEYATPRGNVLPWSSREELVKTLRSYRDPAEIAAMLGP
ncbi:MAG: fused MFS/spermidine synthase [Polyangiaceae bacterium]|nr:fused MFS/spermidine synthase [Polyangiaceae bacterium]MCL4748530.1 fused MFS/spermidine synthase [Myxococcales bacterium]